MPVILKGLINEMDEIIHYKTEVSQKLQKVGCMLGVSAAQYAGLKYIFIGNWGSTSDPTGAYSTPQLP